MKLKKSKLKQKLQKKIRALRKKSPVTIFFKKEEEYTRKTSKTYLNKDAVVSVTLLAIISVICAVWAKVMIIMRFSTFPDGSIFFSWHPTAPVIAIFGSVLYIYCLKAKGIDYWLAYFPAVFGIFYLIIEMMCIHRIIEPSALKAFFGPLADALPEILTGPRV